MGRLETTEKVRGHRGGTQGDGSPVFDEMI